MKCPICGTWTTVKSTRESSEFGHMRRRECGNEHSFSTTEVLIPQEKIDEFKLKTLREVSEKGREASAKARKRRRT
jgi:transcriptional regulator NrdR family protein